MAKRPSEALFPANRGSVTGKSKYRIALCWNFRNTGKCHYGDRCKFSHKTCKFNFKRTCPYGEKCKFWHTEPVDVDSRSHGKREGSSSSAPVLASESGNAQTGPKTLVNAEVQNPLKPTASKHKLPPRRASSLKWKRPKKIVGIYADWIDEEPSVPGSASGRQQ
ncbi:zinc finger CCCH domain-containing protein 56-like [Chenopodium quinoa]|uniref:C3H1-type domain-containing protein n=1 Tax=Chenopodium quinoa TaxID=63459 RepID=A0A803LEF1_CHEQI|nr:zinc finger CCCH domain-containing protein 56-like [Chenopodium quinoa]